jgi:hypothetical protein
VFLLAAVALGGLVLDHRTLLGAPLWLKPGKFGIAFGAYALTLAWLLSRLEKAKRLGWWAGTVFAVCGVLDVAVIAYAAASGTFSHFNTSSDPVNRLVQSVFEFAVPPILVAILVVAVLVLVQRTGTPAVTTALRGGLGLAILGIVAAIALGGRSGATPRTVPDANGGEATLLGGHGSAGAADGRGMWLTDWSTTGGDLRVPHFIGLHGIHVLLLVAFLFPRWIRAASVGYTGIFVLSFWQAWRGQSVLHPDARTLIGLAAVAAVTGLLLGLQQVRQVRQRRDADVGVEAAQRGDRAAGRLARVDAGL